MIVSPAPTVFCTVTEKAIVYIGDPSDPIILRSLDNGAFTTLFTRPCTGEAYTHHVEVYDPIIRDDWKTLLRQELYIEYGGEIYPPAFKFTFDPQMVIARQREATVLALDKATKTYYCITSDAELPMAESYFLYIGDGQTMRRLRISGFRNRSGAGTFYTTAERSLVVKPGGSGVVKWGSDNLVALDTDQYAIYESPLGEMTISSR